MENIIVNLIGNGIKSVQEAIDRIEEFNENIVEVQISPGCYKESINIYNKSLILTGVNDDLSKTIIENTNDSLFGFGNPAIDILSHNVTIKNLTIKSHKFNNKHSAPAISAAGTKINIINNQILHSTYGIICTSTYEINIKNNNIIGINRNDTKSGIITDYYGKIIIEDNFINSHGSSGINIQGIIKEINNEFRRILSIGQNEYGSIQLSLKQRFEKDINKNIYPIIKSNKIVNNITGIQVVSSNPLIEGNEISKNECGILKVEAYPTLKNNRILSNNTIDIYEK
jgi:parallel beta-helix repeat protein